MSKSEFCVDCATLKDLDSWMQLVQLLRWNFPGLDTQEALAAYRETVKKHMGRGSALCALDGDTVVGFLLFSTKHNMLCHLGVHPDYRRKRIASALIARMLKSLDRSRDITVVTFREEDDKGTAPRALYQRFGFEEGPLCFELNYPEQTFILRAR